MKQKTLLDDLFEKKIASKNKLKTMIQNGSIWVNGHEIRKANTPIVGTPDIQIRPKPIIENGYELPILYEDNDLLAIEKPAGLLTIATEKEKKNTAYHFVHNYVFQTSHQPIFIIHRLDQETSGIVLFAKNETTKHWFQTNWNQVVKKRAYYALVDGIHLPKQGTIHTWLKETKTHFVYATNDRRGKEAITHYKVLRENKDTTLLHIEIETGRKNQIRVHMNEIGHPILGDRKYGNKRKFPRLALHAYSLEFLHPKTKKVITLTTALPTNLSEEHH